MAGAPRVPSRSVVLAGATGLVGAQVLQGLLLAPDVAKVQVLARRPLDASHPKLQVQAVDFARLPALEPVDEAYLALGTTIGIAGSQEAFRAVDLHANLAVAQAAVAAGAQRIALVSAVGADANSSVFYNRVKGELEDALKALPLQALVIAQPSLLLGDRQALKQPPRFGEGFAAPVMRWISPLLPGRYRPVEGASVARALVKTLPTARGLVVLSSDELGRLGAG